jgi:O-6-methylguanine DNA methyltransferase
MSTTEADPLVSVLAGLAVDAPPDLAARLVSGWVRVAASVGELYVAFTDAGVSYLRTAESMRGGAAEFCESYRTTFGRPLYPAARPPAGLRTTLRTGRRSASLRFDLRNSTEFERDVLNATLRIPAGETRPYAWLASQIGRPRAVRAVGSALGRNPVPLLIPCHRVTRSDGRPGDYVFGASAKERLLRAERVDLEGVRALADSGVFYVGSDSTGIVCFPTCHNAKRITPAHRRGFRSVAEAGRAGYRPCRDCRPVLAETG